MNVLELLVQHGGQMGQVMDAVTTPYPPSFDNNPLLFGWALFARLLIVLLASATLVRIASRNAVEKIAANHPVYYHRMTVASFLWAGLLGALSDVLTYLFWGETSFTAAATIFTTARLLDALTMIPFMAALFVPLWLRWLCKAGFLRSAPQLTLNGVVNDVRTMWDSKSVPMTLFCYSAIGSAVITVGKYWLWLEHARL